MINLLAQDAENSKDKTTGDKNFGYQNTKYDDKHFYHIVFTRRKHNGFEV